VAGHGRSPDTLQRALALGAIDSAHASAADAVAGADLVLLAVPVAATEATLQAIAPHLAPQALVMDVGSTKADVVAAARRAFSGPQARLLGGFVPAHPIAGKECAGIEHADAQLYRQRQLILTPLPETLPAQVQRARQLWTLLGSQVHQMSPEQHDATYAAVSHLPHLVAFAAMHALLAQPQGADYLRLAGPGFRDFSRIAASDPHIWRDILLANREQVLWQSAQLRQSLAIFEATLHSADGPALHTLIGQASQARAAWQHAAAAMAQPHTAED
jgi:prephenate dehydrogenase